MKKYTGWGKAIYSSNYKKLLNFVETDKGKEFVSKLHTDYLTHLAKRYNCPFVLFFKNDTKNYKLIQKACNDKGVIVVKTTVYPTIKPNIIDYTIPKNLTKTEIKAIDSKRPKKSLGKAEFLHRRELDKMEIWEESHPYPTDKEVAENLFNEQIRQWWRDAYVKKQLAVRDLLSRMYCKERVKLIARYQINDDKYVEKLVTTTKLAPQDANRIPLIPETAKVIKMAQKIAKTAVCCRIVNMAGTSGRIVLAA